MNPSLILFRERERLRNNILILALFRERERLENAIGMLRWIDLCGNLPRRQWPKWLKDFLKEYRIDAK